MESNQKETSSRLLEQTVRLIDDATSLVLQMDLSGAKSKIDEANAVLHSALIIQHAIKKD